MWLEVRKTITCRLFQLTKRKLTLLDEVYAAWQDMVKKPYAENRKMHPEVYSMYAAHASQAKQNDPVYLGTQSTFKVIETDNKIKYFAGITIKPRVRIWCPLKTKQTIDGKVCDSKLVRRDGHYELHLSISKEVEINTHPSAILAVDMGERNIATAVLLANDPRSAELPTKVSRPMFMGRKVRGLRRHYAYLRKVLGQKKLLRVIKRIKDTESRKVNDILHKISRELVNIAKEKNAIILLGDLSGIRNRTQGKRFNRIVANMPFYQLTQYVTYKASWEGIPVLTTREWYSSKLCHKCGSDNTSRPHQGLFVCHSCGYECNADYNGAVNLGNRLAEHVFANGTVGFHVQESDNFLRSDKSGVHQPST